MKPPFHISVSPDRVDQLPTRHGVVLFEGHGGETVLIASASDVRAFAAKRIGPEGGEGGGGRTDLRLVTRWIRVVACSSLFETDAAYLEWARELAPKTYRAATDRWRGWFLRLDPDADVPVWKKTNLSDTLAEGSPPARPETLIGPIRGKDPAARFGQALDDLFELCREPRLLAQRPNATACAYKEMGKCPAPCDGSEPMEAYRERVRGAIALCGGMEGADIASRIDESTRAMEACARSMDFEGAAEMRTRAESYATLAKPSARAVTTLDRFRVLGVLPAGKAGWARVVHHRAGLTSWVADICAKEKRGLERAADDLIDTIDTTDEGSFGLTRERVERIGLVCHHMFSGKKTRGTLLPVSAGTDRDAVLRALRRAAKVELDEPAADSLSESEVSGF